MGTTSREPNTPLTALVRHVLDDGSRTWRALMLILAIAMACSVTAVVVITAIRLTGAGSVPIGGGVVSGLASGWLGGRLWSRRRTAK